MELEVLEGPLFMSITYNTWSNFDTGTIQIFYLKFSGIILYILYSKNIKQTCLHPPCYT